MLQYKPTRIVLSVYHKFTHGSVLQFYDAQGEVLVPHRLSYCTLTAVQV